MALDRVQCGGCGGMMTAAIRVTDERGDPLADNKQTIRRWYCGRCRRDSAPIYRERLITLDAWLRAIGKLV